MASLPGNPSHQGAYESATYKEFEESGRRWYYSKKEIEEYSPSRQDGMDLKKETYLRKSYCTFLQDLGMRLKVPQVTIATAIIFCHRFFLRQSHAKNDRRTIATVCMFLAGKVEETPRPLKDVILVSYEIIHKKDPAAVQRIKQKEVYEHQKELILLGERVVLATLGFDFNVHHPYKPLVEAIKKFKVAQNALAQVAWNFVNDGLRTSLCLQFMPHHIAAGAIFLAAKFLKVKLPSDGEKVWWQEFDVTPRQLEDVSNQMLELYEQNKVPPSQASEAEGSAGGGQRPTSKAPASSEENVVNNGHPQESATTSMMGYSKQASRPITDQLYSDNHVGSGRTAHSRNSEHENNETYCLSERNGDGENDDNEYDVGEEFPQRGNIGEVQNTSRFGPETYSEQEQEKSEGRKEVTVAGQFKDKYHGRISAHKDKAVGQSPQEVIKKIDKDKVKAALEKRRKSRPDISRKTDIMDDDELIEMELEDGIELATEDDKSKPERKQPFSKYSNRPEPETSHRLRHCDKVGDGHFQATQGQLSHGKSDNAEEGELEPFDNADQGYRSPKLTNRKRKASSPLNKAIDGKQRHEYMGGNHNNSHLDFSRR